MGAAILLVIYLSGALLAWGWSPGAWPELLRGVVAVLGAFVAICAIVAVADDWTVMDGSLSPNG